MFPKPTGRVLVIGDDMRIFLTVVRALGRAGKTVDAFPYGPSPALKSRYIARIHEAPVFDLDQQGWRDRLIGLLRAEAFDIVIPCSDPAIACLDQNRSLLARQRLAIPPASAMDLFYDKEATHTFCEGLGVAMAPWSRLRPADSAESLVASFGLPLVLKPRRTFFADKDQAREVVEIVDDMPSLTALLSRIEDRARYLVEGFFPGEGVGVSVLADKGRVLQAFQHRRLREGKGGPSTFRISERLDPALRAATETMSAATGHTGVCMFEFRHNPDTGRWILIEINARFWGSMALPVSLGLDYPNRLYDLMVNGIATPEKPYAAGVLSRNLLLDGFNLLRRIPQLRVATFGGWLSDAGGFALQPLRWLSGRETSDSFVLDDLKPAFWEFTEIARKLSRPSAARAAGLQTDNA